MLNEFKNPSNSYRPIPFWSWNDKLEPEEIRRQIGEMKKARVGGYFMHARSGLKTPYLSEEWFDCIEAGIEGAKETGLNAWAYDEEGWPSGFAGGAVPAICEDYQAKYISLEEYDRPDQVPEGDWVGIFAYNASTGDYRALESGASCEKEEKVLAVKRNVNMFYIDTLNKLAVEAFLESTHEKYYARFGEDFGKYMHGFFTDEPRLTCDFFRDLAWSDHLPEEFEKTYGYDIREKLPALYFETAEYEKVRFDFWTLVNRMFAENYMKTIYDWCEAHNCKATGHIMMEESIFSQMTSTGGVMPFYEYLHMPGIDWLRRPIASPVVPKQVGSVACQLGKKRVITESFALSGWNVSFEELKRIAEWQFVNGVNVICQHLQGYTIRGVRKRDYPPSLFIQQTWWEEYGKFNDYLGRLCVALSAGNQVADVLLLHPMRSGYVLYDGTRTDAMRKLDDDFTKASCLLSGQHISYHFGDETIIEKYGDVRDGAFIVGEIAYKTVILPTMYAINGRTLELLLQFTAQGGTILSLGRLPSYTNGNMADLEKLAEAAIAVSEDDVRNIMAEKKLVALSVEAHGCQVESITHQQRETEDGTIVFLVNHDQQGAYDTKVTIENRRCTVRRMIAETGEIVPTSAGAEGDHTVISLHFDPMQSYILLLQDTDAGLKTGDGCVNEGRICGGHNTGCLSNQEDMPVQTVKPGKDWTIKETGPNALTLDLCQYAVDGGEWQGPVATIKVQQALLDLQRPCDVKLKFGFEVEELPEGEMDVVIEDAHLYRIFLNGQPVSNKDKGYWKDKSFRRVDISGAVKEGANELILETRFQQPQKVYDVLYGENVYETEINKITYDMEIENIYLLGSFGVYSKAPFTEIERGAMVTDGPFVIRKAPGTLPGKDFARNGLLFFAEKMTLEQTISVKKIPGTVLKLDLSGQKAPLVQVYVNGVFVKDSFWAPYSVDITDAAVDGDNVITLKVYASNRNLFGPHHNSNGECFNVGPESFTGRWSWVERKSEADATEIFDMEKDYWTDTYCFTEFGVS